MNIKLLFSVLIEFFDSIKTENNVCPYVLNLFD